MKKMSPEQIDEAVRILRKSLNVLKDPTRQKIVMLLMKANKPLYFAEIKKSFEKELSAQLISYHLKTLHKAGILTNRRGLDMSTGRARTSFYTISERGRWLIEDLLKTAEEWNERSSRDL